MNNIFLDAPIGVFDSGVGGLSVFKAIRAELPHEHVVYVADSGHAPYGDQTPAFIAERTQAIARFLVEEQQVKAIVLACNTATVVAVNELRAWCPVPVIAMEPAIKPAAIHTRTGVVGVLATSRTVASASVARLCHQYGSQARILLMPCPGLVECVERGDLSGPQTRALVQQYVAPLTEAGADKLVIGCTHYAFLKALIGELAGPTAEVVDPAVAVGRELVRRLGGQLRPSDHAPPGEQFFTSGSTAMAQTVMSMLWGHAVNVRSLPQVTQSQQTSR